MWIVAQPKNVIPGAIFVVPLLRGGYAFGYVTAVSDSFVFCDIFDHVQETPEVPDGIEGKPTAITDLQVLGEFKLKPAQKVGGAWAATGKVMSHPVRPHNRYVRMGLPPRRIDVLAQEPDAPLSSSEAENYPKLASRFAPYAAATIEVAVKRLSMHIDKLIEEWKQDGSPASPESSTKREKGAVAAGDSVLVIAIELGHEGLPSKSDIALRHKLEDAIVALKLGVVTDAGGGGGRMEIRIKAHGKGAASGLKKLIEKHKLDGTVTVEAPGRG